MLNVAVPPSVSGTYQLCVKFAVLEKVPPLISVIDAVEERLMVKAVPVLIVRLLTVIAGKMLSELVGRVVPENVIAQVPLVVGAPPFQLLDVFQLLSPPPPVHVVADWAWTRPAHDSEIIATAATAAAPRNPRRTPESMIE